MNCDIENLLKIAEKQIECGNMEKAIEVYRVALKMEPRNQYLRNRLYAAYLVLAQAEKDILNVTLDKTDIPNFNELKLALMYYNTVIEKNTVDYSIWWRRGIVLWKLDRKYDAIKSIENALSLEPNNMDILVDYMFYYQLFQKAQEWKEVKVLIIDDQREIYKIFEDIFVKLCFSPFIARSSIEVLEKLALAKFNYIILNTKMAETNYKEIYEMIKKTSVEAARSIIFFVHGNTKEDAFLKEKLLLDASYSGNDIKVLLGV